MIDQENPFCQLFAEKISNLVKRLQKNQISSNGREKTQ